MKFLVNLFLMLLTFAGASLVVLLGVNHGLTGFGVPAITYREAVMTYALFVTACVTARHV